MATVAIDMQKQAGKCGLAPGEYAHEVAPVALQERSARGSHHPAIAPPQAEFFTPMNFMLAFVDVTPSGCWEWAGKRRLRDMDGKPTYGQPLKSEWPRGFATGESVAHRMAWVLANGPIPAGLFVCHRCDNKPCCNPAHLFVGTHQDNMADATAKGRMGPKPRPKMLVQRRGDWFGRVGVKAFREPRRRGC